MGRALSLLAAELECSERTLRRGINKGLLRGRQASLRSPELTLNEAVYVRKYWPLLARLNSALRTERSVRLAVLYGSVATGDDSANSDIDVLVELASNDLSVRAGLSWRLSQKFERPVQIVTLEQARTNPSFFADVLSEGRVIIDRDESWAELKRNESDVLVAALAAEEKLSKAAEKTLAEAMKRVQLTTSES